MEERFFKILQDRFNDLNLTALSKELDIPKTLLHDWVKGKRTPSFKNLHHIKKIAEYLGLSLDDLLLDNPSNQKAVVSSITFEDSGRRYEILINRIK